MKIFKLLAIVFLFTLSLVSEDKLDISEIVRKIQKTNFTQTIKEPEIYVDKKMLSATIMGVDEDKDGLRDEIQKVIYQSLKFTKDLNLSVYKQTIEVIKMLQPKDPPIENSINEHEVYCQYMALPEEVKREISLDFMYSMMIDTKERQEAFIKSEEPSATSLGAEVCN